MAKGKLETYHYIVHGNSGNEVKARSLKEAIGKAAMSEYPAKPDKYDKEEYHIGEMVVRKGKFSWHKK